MAPIPSKVAEIISVSIDLREMAADSAHNIGTLTLVNAQLDVLRGITQALNQRYSKTEEGADLSVRVCNLQTMIQNKIARIGGDD